MNNILLYKFSQKEKVRYCSLIIKDNKEYLFYNKEKNIKQYTNMITNNDEYNILSNHYEISHNFSPFLSKDGQKYYALGGQYMRQNPYIINYKKICKNNGIEFYQCKNKGIYLLQSNNLINWKLVKNEPVIQPNSNFKNFTISIEKKFPCFDSNLCCFYSKIFKKYLLFTRANIKKGVRSIQFLSSDNLIDWSDFQLIKLDTFDDSKDNLYMSKIIEIEDKKLLLGLTIYTNHNKNVTLSHIKVMTSVDCINWIDRGKLIDIPVRKKCSYELKGHATIHLIDIVRNDNNLDIYLHYNYTLENQSIRKVETTIDNILKN